mmetsp:Transcript_19635/g.35637  ORF Transcript_19635/g.35637 Transcript_19635/m.35637 type:complete len:257 (-) Transcript_19635:90-860(-)
MNSNRSVHSHKSLEFFAESFSVSLGFNQCQTTKLCTGTTHNTSFDETRIDFQTGISIHCRFGKEILDGIFVNIGKNDIFFHSQADFTIGILVGKISKLSAFRLAQSSSWNQDSNTHLSFLRLRMNSQKFTTLKGLGRCRLFIVHLDSAVVAINLLNDSRLKVLNSILFNEPHETGLLTILAFTFISENAKDGFTKGNYRVAIGRNPHVAVNRLGNALNGHVASEHDVKAHFTRLCIRARLHTNIVNVSMRKVITRS